MSALSVLTALLTVSGSVAADEVRLANGGRLSGMAREDGDQIVVRMGAGDVILRKADVVAVIPGWTLLHEYDEKLERAEAAGAPSALFELAVWARDNGLFRYVSPLLARVVAAAPDHAEAHRLLGHVPHEGKWMTEDERFRARGYVRFRGSWVPAEDREKALREEASKREDARKALLKRGERPLARRPVETVPYTLGLPRYAPSRGSRVWTSGWYSTFGNAWYMTPYAHGTRGIVLTLVPYVRGSGRHGGAARWSSSPAGDRSHR